MSIFNTVKRAKISRTAFDLSHEKKLSFEMGNLIPILCEEVVPGDKFKINSETMLRFAPMIFPIMHRVNVFVHYFYVPNRILWDGWEGFITGDDSTTVPKIALGNGYNNGSLCDYIGIPEIKTGWSGTDDINALPFYAYMKIWNEYYRDQNLQSEVEINELNAVSWAKGTPKKRAWEKDYFTSSLPWAQKGSTVDLQLDTDFSPIYRDPASVYGSGGSPSLNGDLQAVLGKAEAGGTEAEIHNLSNDPDDEASMVTTTMDINEFRLAHRLQRWLEKNARAGSRYTEHLLAHWGVKSKDARLQRPEYIGGGKSPVVISEVLNTYGSDDANAHPQGTLAGHGLSVGTTNKAGKFCEEHGFIMGIMSVLPVTHYQQGLHKKFSRLTNLDYYYPEFARLGEQEVLNKEVYCDPTDATYREDTFGYQARFAEYKYGVSTVHGEFRDTMEDFHMGRIFASQPALNEAFVTPTPADLNRIFAGESIKHPMWCQVYNNVKALRPMPYYNDPTI